MPIEQLRSLQRHERILDAATRVFATKGYHGTLVDEAALKVVLDTLASHRRLARLFMVEALGAGPEFNTRMLQIRASFADLIRTHLDEAVAAGAIPPLDTATAASAWFGAVNEVVIHWALAENPGRLEDAYPTIRALLLRGVQASGVDARVG